MTQNTYLSHNNSHSIISLNIMIQNSIFSIITHTASFLCRFMTESFTSRPLVKTGLVPLSSRRFRGTGHLRGDSWTRSIVMNASVSITQVLCNASVRRYLQFLLIYLFTLSVRKVGINFSRQKFYSVKILVTSQNSSHFLLTFFTDKVYQNE